MGALAVMGGLALHSYTVHPGDSLSAIAQSQCHYASDWTGIYAASHAVVGGNPDLIEPGQRLTVRCSQDATVAADYRKAHASVPVIVVAHDSAQAHLPGSIAGDSDSDGGGNQSGSSQSPAQLVSTPSSSSSGCYDPSGVLSDAQVAMVWNCAGGSSSQDSNAIAITACESGHNTHAYNPSGATGLFQILGSVVSGDLYDAHVNALNAVAKYNAAGGWSPWVCQP
jgi:LysM repeat protein